MLRKSKIGILSIGFGSVGGLRRSFRDLNVETYPVTNSTDLKKVDALILPGVGSFSNAMKRIQQASMVDDIIKFRSLGQSILGICLGFQLMTNGSEEELANVRIFSEGLGFFAGETRFMNSNRSSVLGWYETYGTKANVKKEFFFYNHRLMVDGVEPRYIEMLTGYEVVASVKIDNLTGVQFHPEKSQYAGRKWLAEWCAEVSKN